MAVAFATLHVSCTLAQHPSLKKSKKEHQLQHINYTIIQHIDPGESGIYSATEAVAEMPKPPFGVPRPRCLVVRPWALEIDAQIIKVLIGSHLSLDHKIPGSYVTSVR